MNSESRSIPKHHIEVLGYYANTTDTSPSFSPRNSTVRGIGGEGEVHEYTVTQEDGSVEKMAIKVFHLPFERFSDETQSLYRIPIASRDAATINIEQSKPAYIVATNARFCGRIHNAEKAIKIINKQEDLLRANGTKGYHLRTLQESFGSTEYLNTQGFLNFLRQRAIASGNHSELQRIPQFIPSPREYKGGMISAINTMAEWASKNFPKLMIPKKVFPDFYQFGVFDDNIFTEELNHKFYVVMECVPNTLISVMKHGFEQLERTTGTLNGTDTDPNEMIKQITTVIHAQLPLRKMEQIRTMLEMLHSLGFVFGDLKRGNIGILGNGNPVLLDPSSMIRTGAIQDFASLEFLPPDQQQLLSVGRLRGLPTNDIYAYSVISQGLKVDLQYALQQGFSIQNIETRERVDHETATMRAKSSRGVY